MTVLFPGFALIAFVIAFVTGYLINSKFQYGTNKNRFDSIDGLRGFLALGVFIHHTAVWYKYIHTGSWTSPGSNLFSQLGSTSVAFFFMISSFLFVNKLLEFKRDEFDWKSFFIKRVFRLVPLHFLALAIIIFIVFVQSGWQLHVTLFAFAKSVVKWMLFGVMGMEKELNTIPASKINSGVLWSLPYEWLLYFALPIIALFISKFKKSWIYITLGIVFIAVSLQYRNYLLEHLISFVGGAIAPFVIHFNKKKSIDFNNLGFTLTTIACISGILFFHSSDNMVCKLFVTISFTLIALGNNVFGLLKNTTLKFLGEISYSTYLLHGVILYVSIHYVCGLEMIKELTETQFCFFVFALSPFIVLISFITFHYVEMPFMNMGRRLSKKGFSK